MNFLFLILAISGVFEKAQWAPNGTSVSENSKRKNLVSHGLHYGKVGHAYDATKVKTFWAYDATGVLTSQTNADAPTMPTSYAYFEDGQAKAIRRGLGPVYAEEESREYNGRGLVTRTQQPNGRDSVYDYNPRGLVQAESYGTGSLRHAMAMAYDAAGRIKTKTDEGQTTSFVYGHQGELRSVTLPVPNATYAYEYDNNTRLRQVTPPSPSATQTWAYDGLNRETRHTLGPSAWTRSWSDGTATRSSPLNDVIAESFDGRGRLARRAVQNRTSAGASFQSATQEYDGDDALRSVTESPSNARETWAYDGSHRLTNVKYTNTPDTTYAYASSANRLPSSRGDMQYQYDEFGRLKNVTGPWGSTAVEWEAGGQRLSKLGSESHCYNAQGWLSGLGSNCLGPERSYTFDVRGNRLTEAFGGLTRTFTFDAADRLTSETTFGQPQTQTLTAYQLNADGSRKTETANGTTKTYAYDARGGLAAIASSAGTDVYLTDAAGRVTSGTTAAGVANYEWDSFGRLTKLSGASGSNATSYGYDALNLRRSASDGRSWTWAGSNGETEIAEGNQSTQNVNGFNLGQGATKFTSHDALGSVMAQSNGTSTSTASYSAFGKRTATAPLTSVGFTGYRQETDTLAYAQQRWMDSTSGRFLSLDSMGAGTYLASPNGMGPWSYGKQNPMRYVDRDGRSDMMPSMMNVGDCESKRTVSGADAVVDACVTEKTSFGMNLWAGAVGLVAGWELVIPACLRFPMACKAVGFSALGGTFTSGQPTLVGMQEQVNQCLVPKSPMDSFMCGVGVGATAAGSAQGLQSIAETNVARAAVLSLALETAEMNMSRMPTGAVAATRYSGMETASASTGAQLIAQLEAMKPATQAASVANVAAADADAAANRVLDPKNNLFSRGSWRKKTIADAEKAAREANQGELVCATCGKDVSAPIIVETVKGPKIRVGYDLDHFPETWSERLRRLKNQQPEPGRSTILDEFNRNVRVQCPECNVSHEWEGKPGDYQGKVE
jgi:RHS repeat-associated protein